MSDVVVITVGVLTSVTLLVGLLVQTYRGLGRLRDIQDTVAVARDNTESVTKVRDDIAAIRGELTANGGTSLKDRVVTLGEQVTALTAAQEEHRRLGNDRHETLNRDIEAMRTELAAHRRDG